MKGIKVTQDLKDKNKDLFKNRVVGDIIPMSMPNKFWGVERVVGGYQYRTDLHDTDGWKDVVTPAYDSELQKRGELIEDGNTFTYTILNKTQTELNQEAAQKKAAEAEKIKEEKIKAYVESVLTIDEMLNYYPEWVQKAYALNEKVTYKGKIFQNNVEGNTNAPDKGGWTEIK